MQTGVAPSGATEVGMGGERVCVCTLVIRRAIMTPSFQNGKTFTLSMAAYFLEDFSLGHQHPSAPYNKMDLRIYGVIPEYIWETLQILQCTSFHLRFSEVLQ